MLTAEENSGVVKKTPSIVTPDVGLMQALDSYYICNLE